MSSTTLHDLKVGIFESFRENSQVDTELLGYYPTFLYSKKVFFVPEVLNKRVLPPIALVSLVTQIKKQFHFVPRNLNLEPTPDLVFILGPLKLRTDFPVYIYTFSFGFDLVSDPDNIFLKDYIRFDVATLTFAVEKEGANKKLVSVDIDLAFKSEAQEPGGPNGEAVHTGTLKLILECGIEAAPVQRLEFDFSVVRSASTGNAEVVNDPFSAHRNPAQADLRLGNLLSPQLLLLKVGLVTPVFFARGNGQSFCIGFAGFRKPATPYQGLFLRKPLLGGLSAFDLGAPEETFGPLLRVLWAVSFGVAPASAAGAAGV